MYMRPHKLTKLWWNEHSRLPDRTASELFSRPYQMRSSKLDPDLNPQYFQFFEMLVGQVAKRWRHVALSTPQLLARFRVSCDRRGRAKARLYLSRSGDLPLDLILETYYIPGQLGKQYVRRSTFMSLAGVAYRFTIGRR
jgi:hypothetical protein